MLKARALDALKQLRPENTLLGFNQIDNDGAVHLGNMLAVNNALTCLDLNGNWVNWQGAQYISALNASANTALKYIDLSSNYIPDDANAYYTLITPMLVLPDNVSRWRLCVRQTEILWDRRRRYVQTVPTKDCFLDLVRKNNAKHDG